MSVAIPATQAALGGGYFLYEIVAEPHPIIFIMAGMFFGSVVFVADRTVLVMHSYMGLGGYVARVVFSVLLALIIGEPVTSIIFEPQIAAQVIFDRKELLSAYNAANTEEAQTANSGQIKILEARLAQDSAERASQVVAAQTALERRAEIIQISEPGLDAAQVDSQARTDPAWLKLQASIAALDDRLTNTQLQIRQLQDEIVTLVSDQDACSSFAEQYISVLKAVEVPDAFAESCKYETYGLRFDGVTGILVKFKALNSYASRNPATWIPMLVIRSTILMIDLLVILLAKSVIRPGKPYAMALEAQERLESERVAAHMKTSMDKLNDRAQIEQEVRHLSNDRLRSRVRALRDAGRHVDSFDLQ